MEPNRPAIFLSIVIPLYNEEESLLPLLQEIKESVSGYLKKGKRCEVWFIDDGSSDRSWEIIDKVIKQVDTDNFSVSGIRFQKNYGKSTALQSGFDHANGEYVITMDADLQDDPAEIPGLIDTLNEKGLDLISGWKKERKDPLSKKAPSRLFNWVTKWITGISIHDFNCGLKAYKSEVVKHIYLYGEMHRYVPVLAKNAGYSAIGEKIVHHRKREFGKTKFGASRFINGFLDLATVLFINAYAQRPMHFFGSIGVMLVLAGTLISGYLAWSKLILGESLQDRPLLFLGVLLIIVGAQFFSIGFLGEMIHTSRSKRISPTIKEESRSRKG